MKEVKLVKTYVAYIEDEKLHVEGIENYGDKRISTLVLDLPETEIDVFNSIIDFIEVNTDPESGLIIRIEDEIPERFKSEPDENKMFDDDLMNLVFEMKFLTVFAHRTGKVFEGEVMGSDYQLYVIREHKDIPDHWLF